MFISVRFDKMVSAKENVINLSSAIFVQRVLKITFGYDNISVNI